MSLCCNSQQLDESQDAIGSGCERFAAAMFSSSTNWMDDHRIGLSPTWLEDALYARPYPGGPPNLRVERLLELVS